MSILTSIPEVSLEVSAGQRDSLDVAVSGVKLRVLDILSCCEAVLVLYMPGREFARSLTRTDSPTNSSVPGTECGRPW